MSETSLNIRNELFERVAGGDEKAFAELFHLYTKKLFPFLLKNLRSDQLAEELLQDIFLKVWVYREKLGNHEAPEKYLFQIAANRVIDHFREEEKKIKIRHQIIPFHLDTDPHISMDIREARKILLEGVEQLPEQRRKVYDLKQTGLSYDEISKTLNISPHTVRNQLVSVNRFLLEFLRNRGLGVLLLILSWKRP